MSTRSDIIVHRADGSYKRVYCHFDGYLEGVGQTLSDHYSSQERADLLVEPGDLLVLAENCDGAPGHGFQTSVEGQCIYYGRDHGESDVAGFVGESLAEVWPPEDTGTEFTYVWQDGKWWVADADEGTQSFHLLADALSGADQPHPHIKVPMMGVSLGRHYTK